MNSLKIALNIIAPLAIATVVMKVLKVDTNTIVVAAGTYCAAAICSVQGKGVVSVYATIICIIMMLASAYGKESKMAVADLWLVATLGCGIGTAMGWQPSAQESPAESEAEPEADIASQ